MLTAEGGFHEGAFFVSTRYCYKKALPRIFSSSDIIIAVLYKGKFLFFFKQP